MSTTADIFDVARLVAVVQAQGEALGLSPIGAEAIEARIRDVLVERELLECVADGLITEREAACALLDRVAHWMLAAQSKSWPSTFDYSEFENAAQEALFGTRHSAIRVRERTR